MKCLTVSILVFVFVSSFCWAQEPDTVYLKDGSIIKGKIIETTYTTDMRIETLKVRIAGGSILAFTGDKIQKIQTGQQESPLQKSLSLKPQPIKSKQITNYKSPGTACILSLLLAPGIGQFYNEQPGKGAVFLGIGILGLAMFIDGSKEVITYSRYSGYSTGPKNQSGEGLGALIYLGTWIVSAIDAYDSAKKINESLLLSMTPNKISLCYRF